jgi:hypothetical protein
VPDALRHEPLSQTPALADVLQFEPAATHFAFTQQPSPAQTFP